MTPERKKELRQVLLVSRHYCRPYTSEIERRDNMIDEALDAVDALEKRVKELEEVGNEMLEHLGACGPIQTKDWADRVNDPR